MAFNNAINANKSGFQSLSSVGVWNGRTLQAGAGIAIDNPDGIAGDPVIRNTGAGFTWNDVTGGSAALAAQNGYYSDSGSLTTFTLPTSAALGDEIVINGKGAGGWTVVYGALQNIIIGNQASTTTTGNIASTNQYDVVVLRCVTASITAPIFQVVQSFGNISYA